MSDCWNPAFAHLHPVFTQLAAVQIWQDCQTWPSCERLNTLLPQSLTANTGKPLHFLPQDHTLPYAELPYEERIFQHGVIATRPNWHDFFNALIWGLFPHSKVVINTLHGADIAANGKGRTLQRDALTLLDESGLIIAASRTALLEQIMAFEWEQVFVAEKAAWGREIAAFAFGHALLEKLLTPFIGLTAHALLVAVEADFFQQDLPAQQAYLDQVIAKALQQAVMPSPKHLNPLPVLGRPDWWPQQNSDFYQNQAYFRPYRQQRPVSIIFSAHL